MVQPIKDPFSYITDFEKVLSEHTGAPYVVTVDCCTHAIELAMRYDKVNYCRFTAHTYLSVVQTMHILGIDYTLVNEDWTGEYQFHGTRIWDSARRLEKNMYRPGMIQCISFGHTKPLELGKGGALLLDDKDAADMLRKQRFDGRNLTISPWPEQKVFPIGYHYNMPIEFCKRGIEQLPQLTTYVTHGKYYDCREIKITN